MAFEGWLIKLGGVVLPNKYIVNYVAKPNMRIEIDAYRDSGTLTLHRTTSPYYKSQITVSIRSLMFGEKLVLKAILDSAYLIPAERKVRVDYWNDEDMEYRSGEFYTPDIEYKIKHVDERKLDMVYSGFDMTFIEY